MEKGAKEAIPTIIPDEKATERVAKSAVEIVREGEAREWLEAHAPRRCCLYCKHIRASVRDPFCGITLRDIIGNPRLMSCARFEPTLEESEDGTNE